MTTIPRGPDHLYCPFWRQKMSKCCHTCPFWQMLRGVHPQTGEPIPDEWNCSLGHITKLLIENSQQSRQTGAAVESFRNEMVKANEAAMLMHAQDQARRGSGTLLEGTNREQKWTRNG